MINRTLYSFNPFRTIITTSQDSMHEDPGKQSTNHNLHEIHDYTICDQQCSLAGWVVILVAFSGLGLIGKDYILGNHKPQTHF